MNRWSNGFLGVIFAFVIVLLAGFVSFSVRAAFHSQSHLITGIVFFVTVVCLVLGFEKSGQEVWKYPGGTNGVDDSTVGGIGQDEKSTFVIGFNGDGGLIAVNSQGN